MGHPTWVIALIIWTGTLTQTDTLLVLNTTLTVEGGVPKSS